MQCPFENNSPIVLTDLRLGRNRIISLRTNKIMQKRRQIPSSSFDGFWKDIETNKLWKSEPFFLKHDSGLRFEKLWPTPQLWVLGGDGGQQKGAANLQQPSHKRVGGYV